MEGLDALDSGAVLSISGLGKRYGTGKALPVTALDNIGLSAQENEFVCLVGPSGCGKSTLLRIAAGLEPASSGEICYRSQRVIAPRPEIGMVFQEYSLLPWRNVLDNISLGPEFSGMGKAKRRALAKEHLALVGLSEFALAMPHELSGGMRQRVAIARALCNAPDLLLMDEPFGALDAYTRIILQKELLKVWQRRKATIIFVTHSVDEAVWLADRIIVMSARPGRIIADIPVTLCRPRNRAEPEYGILTSRILEMLEGAPQS